jgi:hypothetical protein
LAESRGDRTGERPREGATLGRRVGEGGSCGMMGNLEDGSLGEKNQFRRGYGVWSSSVEVEGTAWFCRFGRRGSCRSGCCTMVMPGDERQMPGEGWRDLRANCGSDSREYGGQQ